MNLKLNAQQAIYTALELSCREMAAQLHGNAEAQLTDDERKAVDTQLMRIAKMFGYDDIPHQE